MYRAIILTLAIALGSVLANAESDDGPDIRPVTSQIGEMVVDLPSSIDRGDGPQSERQTLRFEPLQMADDLLRDDIVLLMRHGPTDWSTRDAVGVEPTDCANQRLMTQAGQNQMRDLGILMAGNGLLPSQIIASQWCRNQQTLEALLEGMAALAPDATSEIVVQDDPDTNLLLSLRGASDVSNLEAMITAWRGSDDQSGPLLIISHYTNIEELTQFRVFEGEMLVIDPQRENRVLGYVRLRSAAPDIGHFADDISSPIADTDAGVDVVERYIAALNADDDELVADILSRNWVGYGSVASATPAQASELEGVIDEFRDGLTALSFSVDQIHASGDIVTVIGNISGRHSGELFGQAPSGRSVEFSAIAVHRIEAGEIVESWITTDRLSLLEQISN